jgi:transcriptional regulator with XRE-family HTH domain
MNQDMVGAFMQSLRKEQGMTQKDLAERIGVSDKTISKWENGNSMPDTSILLSLCKELDISVNELLACEKIPPEEYSKKAEVNMMKLIRENQEQRRNGRAQVILGCLVFIALVVLSFLSIGANLAIYVDVPAVLFLLIGLLGVALLSGASTWVERLHVLRVMVIPIGALESLITSVTVFQNVDMQGETVGPCLAVASLSLLYAIGAYIVFYILELRLQKR